MKAQIISHFGDPSVFKMEEISTPTLKSGTLLIKVHATSVNPIDCKIRSGAVPNLAPQFPAILQGDVAGTVVAVGPEITSFKEGDEVFGYAGGVNGLQGALAEYMLVDSQLIAKKPKRLSMKEAAALALVCITAWEALFVKAKITNHDYVLVHGGVGGVGHVAIQLAKSCGARVATTILKPQDVAIVKSFGADEVINAKEEDVEDYVKRLTNGEGFDVVFDTVGGANLDRSFVAAKLNGVVSTIAARGNHDLTNLHNNALSLHAAFTLLPLIKNQFRDRYGKILTQIATLADEGKLQPLIDPEDFSFDKVAQAHQKLESGQAQGKIVITLS